MQPGPQGMPEVELAAQSLDLKAGQAVDRVGVMLGIGVSPAGRSWSGPPWPGTGR